MASAFPILERCLETVGKEPGCLLEEERPQREENSGHVTYSQHHAGMRKRPEGTFQPAHPAASREGPGDSQNKDHQERAWVRLDQCGL